MRISTQPGESEPSSAWSLLWEKYVLDTNGVATAIERNMSTILPSPESDSSPDSRSSSKPAPEISLTIFSAMSRLRSSLSNRTSERKKLMFMNTAPMKRVKKRLAICVRMMLTVHKTKIIFQKCVQLFLLERQYAPNNRLNHTKK